MSKCIPPSSPDLSSLALVRREGEGLLIGAHTLTVSKLHAWGAELLIDGAPLRLCVDAPHVIDDTTTLTLRRADRPARICCRLTLPREVQVSRVEKGAHT